MNQTEGLALRKWRERKGLERADLGALVNVSAATVANWELGRNKPRGAALEKLEKLIKGETAVIPLTPQEERLLDENVRQGGFGSREEFLAHILLEQVRTNPLLPSLKRAPARSSAGGAV